MAQVTDRGSSPLTDMQEHMMQHICDTFGEDVIVIFRRKNAVTGEDGVQTVSALSQQEILIRVQGLAKRLLT